MLVNSNPLFTELDSFSFKESKGYLYKIKNETNKTIGYLFGTIHMIPEKQPFSLNEKIFKALGKSKTLFLEIKDLSLDQNSIEKMLLIWISRHRQPMLKGLETRESREAARQNEELPAQKLTLLAYEYLDQVNKLSLNSPPVCFGEILLKGTECLQEATKLTRLDDLSYKEMESLSNLYIEAYQKYLNINVESIIRSFLAQVKINQIREENELIFRQQFQWARGDRFEDFTNFSPLKQEEISLRDKFMLNTILTDLSQAVEKNERNFYAMGCFHLEGNYVNLKSRLENHGFKIINAYGNS